MVSSICLGCSCKSVSLHGFTGKSMIGMSDVGAIRATYKQGFLDLPTHRRGMQGNRNWSHRRRVSCTIKVRAVLAEPSSSDVSQVLPRKQNGLLEPAVASASQILSEATTSSTAHKQELGLNETRLYSTLQERMWVLVGASATAGMMLKAVWSVHSPFDAGGLALGTMAAYLFADLATGIYHWGVDNYGDASTPVFGSQIDAFQGHHKRPWTITKREFCNNTQAIARPVGLALLPFLLLPNNSTADAFLGVFLGLVIMSQQIHSWAHCKKGSVPAVVDFLQERGILVSRKMHGVHHRSPYNINYCIISGLWNSLLNKSKVFKWLESVIYSRWRIAPRCWADIIPTEWLQEGSYFEDGSDLKTD